MKYTKAFLVFLAMFGILISWTIWTFGENAISCLNLNEIYFVKTAWPEVSPDGQTNATIVVQKVVGGKLNPKQMMDVRLGGDLPKPGQLVMFGADKKLVIVGTMAESVTEPVAPVEPAVAPASDSVVDPISTPAVKQEKFAPVIPPRKTTAKK